MFDLGWSELVIVGIVALIVIGPKELPGVLRMLGQWIGKVRRMASDFQGQFQEAMREAEMSDLKKQVDDLADTTRDLTSDFDPLSSMTDTFDDPLALDEPDKSKQSGEAAAAAETPLSASEPAAPPQGDEAKTDTAASPEKAAAEGRSA